MDHGLTGYEDPVRAVRGGEGFVSMQICIWVF